MGKHNVCMDDLFAISLWIMDVSVRREIFDTIDNILFSLDVLSEANCGI